MSHSTFSTSSFLFGKQQGANQPTMPPRVPLLVRAFRLERSFHVNRPIFATDPDLPPALRTAADLGFTGNAGRVRDFSKLDIPVSSRFDINTTRPTGSSMGAGIKPQQVRFSELGVTGYLS
jgi:hypothetical protein